MLLDLCKLWISQLVTIYTLNTQHNLNTLSSSWHFCIYFWRAQAFFLYLDCPVVEEIWRFWFSRHHTIEVSHDFLGGASSSWFSTLPSFRGHGPFECGDKSFSICHLTTWSICYMTLWVGFPYPKSPPC